MEYQYHIRKILRIIGFIFIPFLMVYFEFKEDKNINRKYVVAITLVSFFVFIVFWKAMLGNQVENDKLRSKITQLNKTIENENKNKNNDSKIIKIKDDKIQSLKKELKDSMEYGKLTDKEKLDLKKKAEEKEKALAAKEKAAKEKKIYEKWIESQFSSWDGDCKLLKEKTKPILNNPDSYKHLSTKYWEQKDLKSVIVLTNFTASNLLGGIVQSTAKCKLIKANNENKAELIDFELIE